MDGEAKELDMSPSPSVKDVLYRSSRNAELFCQRVLRCASRLIPRSDLSDSGLGKSGVAFVLAAGRMARGVVASFRDHVGYVVGASSKEKMLRITARCVVAFVKHAQTLRDWSA